MKETLLGKRVEGLKRRDAGILFSVKRPEPGVMMYGFDIMRAYEFSWLNGKGRPVAAVMELIYPRKSDNIVESKSLKLYLNGLAFERFETEEEVASTVKADLSPVLVSPWIRVRLFTDERLEAVMPTKMEGIVIDYLDTSIAAERLDPGLLQTLPASTEERLISNLLHTNCPITSQPDRATVIIDYAGPQISRESLLQYICSFSSHEDFSETCCERIFTDISRKCSPERLLVRCLYTRRGGIDINPVRASFEVGPEDIPAPRHIRQ